MTLLRRETRTMAIISNCWQGGAVGDFCTVLCCPGCAHLQQYKEVRSGTCTLSSFPSSYFHYFGLHGIITDICQVWHTTALFRPVKVHQKLDTTAKVGLNFAFAMLKNRLAWKKVHHRLVSVMRGISFFCYACLESLLSKKFLFSGEPAEKSCLWGINRGVKGKENKKKISHRAIQITIEIFIDLRKTKNNLWWPFQWPNLIDVWNW